MHRLGVEKRSGPMTWFQRMCLMTLAVAAALSLAVQLMPPRAGPATSEAPRARSAPELDTPRSAASPASSRSHHPTPFESASSEQAADHYVIEVTGRDFRWDFQVVQPERAAGRYSRTLPLPAGVRVDWKLTSDDYIYTFSSPDLGIRELAAPGLSRELRTIEGVQSVEIDLSRSEVIATYDPGTLSTTEIGVHVTQLGYEATRYAGSSQVARK